MKHCLRVLGRKIPPPRLSFREVHVPRLQVLQGGDPDGREAFHRGEFWAGHRDPGGQVSQIRGHRHHLRYLLQQQHGRDPQEGEPICRFF